MSWVKEYLKMESLTFSRCPLMFITCSLIQVFHKGKASLIRQETKVQEGKRGSNCNPCRQFISWRRKTDEQLSCRWNKRRTEQTIPRVIAPWNLNNYCFILLWLKINRVSKVLIVGSWKVQRLLAVRRTKSLIRHFFLPLLVLFRRWMMRTAQVSMKPWSSRASPFPKPALLLHCRSELFFSFEFFCKISTVT